MGRKSLYAAKRVDVLQAIHQLMIENHRTPTVREISEKTGISVSTLHGYLERLHEEGMVEWRARRHRSMKLTPSGQRLANTSVPF